MPATRLSRDASIRGLFGPNRHYRYLVGAEERPFHARASGFDRANAWWLVELSMLAYIPELRFKRACLQRVGFTDLRVFESSHTGAQCMVAHNDTVVLVIFRGTELGSGRDLLTDANFLWGHEVAGGRVHRGFKQALDSIWRPLNGYLERVGPSRALWLAGHSLGGALATLAASRLAGGGAGVVQGLMTFGSPRVGDGRFAQAIACPAWRVVNGNDLIARLPPTPYRHVGQLCYLDRHGGLHLNPADGLRWEDRWRGQFRHAQAVLRRWRDGDWRVVFNDDLYDHAPIHYVRWLRRLAFAEGLDVGSKKINRRGRRGRRGAQRNEGE